MFKYLKQEWNLHYFALTDDCKLVYTEERQLTNDEERDEKVDGVNTNDENNVRNNSTNHSNLKYLLFSILYSISNKFDYFQFKLFKLMVL